MATARPVIMSGCTSHDSAVPAFLDARLVRVVAVVIVNRNRAFDTLAVGRRREVRRVSATEVSPLTGVGRHASIAINNTRLYESMRYDARQIIRAQESSVVAELKGVSGSAYRVSPEEELVRFRIDPVVPG